MEIKELKTINNRTIHGPLVLIPDIYHDNRGYFYESWNLSKLNLLLGKSIEFVQDNEAYSNKGVLRGMHYQIPPKAQGKLIRCIEGQIYDVIIDIRKSSSTFGQWSFIFLNAENHKQLWIPPGFAHGHLTMTKTSKIIYKATDYWSPDHERSINWSDPNVGIDWPFIKASISNPILSKKDILAPLLMELCSLKDFFE